MVECPKCKTENRSGAKFCKNCAAALPPSSPTTLPLEVGKETRKLVSQSTTTVNINQTQEGRGYAARTGTKPLSPAPTFLSRPPGAIFGDAFLFKSLVFSNERQHDYIVSQIDTPKNNYIVSCPKPNCGAVFAPNENGMEKYCTDCGTLLGERIPELHLIENASPIPTCMMQIVSKNLAHASVRVPVAVFIESLGQTFRHIMVLPRVSKIDGGPETWKALDWGVRLARGLNFLHDNGISFGGRIDASSVGLSGNNPVWFNYANCIFYPDGNNPGRLADTRALAALIFHWATGKTQYESDPNLHPAVNQVLGEALSERGFPSAGDLANALEGAMEAPKAAKMVDFQIGRRSHVGMVRTLNEDSLLVLELNRIHQSISRPVGVFVVADGMGGHAAGEVASGTIIDTIAQKALTELFPLEFIQEKKLNRLEWIREAVETANKTVFDLRKTAGTDMGSTLVASVVEEFTANIAHVGDSRAYVINSQGIRQITTDHSLVQRLIATNQITREEARVHPQRNVIYRTIGDKAKVDVEVSSHDLEIGEQLLLCSDGLSGMLDDETLFKLVIEAASPQVACDKLIAAACEAGGDDNVSVIIIKITEP